MSASSNDRRSDHSICSIKSSDKLQFCMPTHARPDRTAHETFQAAQLLESLRHNQREQASRYESHHLRIGTFLPIDLYQRMAFGRSRGSTRIRTICASKLQFALLHSVA
jgi:hypothetical protein